MAKIAFCDECKQYTLTGFMACRKQDLCADCAAKILGVDPEVLRKEFARIMREEEKIIEAS